mmetsp:Transcript_33296/g.63935  ORF Transcript_33296/g.63935 Transcript_33296/m.63935 type:complete len:204 (+) Transcript_33296:2443-3054(+)
MSTGSSTPSGPGGRRCTSACTLSRRSRAGSLIRSLVGSGSSRMCTCAVPDSMTYQLSPAVPCSITSSPGSTRMRDMESMIASMEASSRKSNSFVLLIALRVRALTCSDLYILGTRTELLFPPVPALTKASCLCTGGLRRRRCQVSSVDMLRQLATHFCLVTSMLECCSLRSECARSTERVILSHEHNGPTSSTSSSWNASSWL